MNYTWYAVTFYDPEDKIYYLRKVLTTLGTLSAVSMCLKLCPEKIRDRLVEVSCWRTNSEPELA